MREIKFRQRVNGKFYFFGFEEDHRSGYAFVMPVNLNIKRYPIQQFTGMIDERGSKIFEGDIVGLSNRRCIGYVEFNSSEGRFDIALNEGRKVALATHLTYGDHATCLTIYGNVFENPELIEI